MIESTQVLFWHWWALGAVFVVIEMIAPGTFMLWLGVACAASGLLLLVIPSASFGWQFLTFAVVTIASVFLWRRYQRPTPTDQPTLNQRGQSYVSRTFKLIEPNVNGYGKAEVEDTVWTVSGKDAPAGATVRVVGVDGTVLKVELLDKP
jgi:membrane protein implicated in regulation of membrane protease activity